MTHIDPLARQIDHLKAYRPLERDQERAARTWLHASFERYRQEVDVYWPAQSDRLADALGSVDNALAALLLSTWTFDEEDKRRVPFHDEASAVRWLRGAANAIHDLGRSVNVDERVAEPEELMREERDWRIRTLWSLHTDLAREIDTIQGWWDFTYDTHWSTSIENTRSRLPMPVQHLVADLCRVWIMVDSTLGLPRRDPEPDNPLLRFLDTGLSHAMGDRRPRKSTLLQFVAKFAKQALLAEAEEDRAAELERRARGGLRPVLRP